MPHADLHLRVGRFVKKGEKGNEVFIFGDRLNHAGRAAFFVKRVGRAQFRFGEIFAIRIGIDQGLKIEAGLGVMAVLQEIEALS